MRRVRASPLLCLALLYRETWAELADLVTSIYVAPYEHPERGYKVPYWQTSIVPADGWFIGHPQTLSTICGQGPYNAGDPIPATALYSQSGHTDASDPSCVSSSGATMLYAYSYPRVAVTNAVNQGFAWDKFTFMMMLDDSNAVYLLAFVDEPDNPNGSTDGLQMTATCTVSGHAAGPDLVVQDDPHEVGLSVVPVDCGWGDRAPVR